MLNQIVNFFLANSETLMLIALVVIFVVLWLLGHKKTVKAVLKQLVIDAEAKYGSGTGAIKYDVVVGWVKQKFPTFFMFISDKTLDKWIKDMVQYLKTELGEEKVQSTNAPLYRDSI